MLLNKLKDRVPERAPDQGHRLGAANEVAPLHGSHHLRYPILERDPWTLHLEIPGTSLSREDT